MAPFACLATRLLPEEKAVRWKQRLGFLPRDAVHFRHRRPLVWVHAVSVGEVRVASTLIHALDQLRPGLGIVVSTTTFHGQQFARKKLAPRAVCIYFPLDFIACVHKALRHVRPDVFVCLETELWPNFLSEARRLGIPTLLLNGRISEKSFRHYQKISPLMKPLLRGFTRLAMSTSDDVGRIIALGAPEGSVVLTGNMKGAGLLEQTDPKKTQKLRRKLGLASDQPVFVAGSIRNRELEWLPEIFWRLLRESAEMVGIFAPRHPNRIERLESWFKKKGVGFQYLSSLMNGSEGRSANIILVDGVGMLFDLYGLGDLIFCGGSLVPLGGQNILEPVAWGKSVFYGPHMDNFLESSRLLESIGCGIKVQGRDDLLANLRHFLTRQKQLESMGRKGRAALRNQDQIAVKQAELVREVLEHVSGGLSKSEETHL
jgi:3-deoxy-D-manno-octulosonic-acid transferase